MPASHSALPAGDPWGSAAGYRQSIHYRYIIAVGVWLSVVDGHLGANQSATEQCYVSSGRRKDRAAHFIRESYHHKQQYLSAGTEAVIGRLQLRPLSSVSPTRHSAAPFCISVSSGISRDTRLYPILTRRLYVLSVALHIDGFGNIFWRMQGGREGALHSYFPFLHFPKLMNK